MVKGTPAEMDTTQAIFDAKVYFFFGFTSGLPFLLLFVS